MKIIFLQKFSLFKKFYSTNTKKNKFFHLLKQRCAAETAKMWAINQFIIKKKQTLNI